MLIEVLGCVGNEDGGCNCCNSGKCGSGICREEGGVVKGVDIDKGGEKMVDYVLGFEEEVRKVMGGIGK